MKNKRYNRYRDPRFIFLLLIGGIIIATMVITSFADTSTPLVVTVTPITPDLNTPVPTPILLPTVEPDGPQLILGEATVHPNGLYQITVPEGWQNVTQQAFDPAVSEARLQFNNPSRLSVIDVILQPGVNYPSHQALSTDYLTSSYFVTAWGDFEGFTETERTVGEAVEVEFLLLSGGVDYLGKQVSWLDEDWLHTIRYVVPDNNPVLLDTLVQEVSPTFVAYEDQRNEPVSYSAYSDVEQHFLIRHPGWQIVSGTPGTPAVFEDFNGSTRLLLRSYPEVAVASLEEAEAFIAETLHAGSEALSAQVLEGEFGSGYMVSYADRGSEGDPISGLAALLADDAGNLLVADLRLTQGDVDLLSLSDNPLNQQYSDVIGSFMVLPPAGYTEQPAENPPAVPEVTATQDALETETAPAEATEEAATEAAP
jgi:hypothetical protein